MRWRQQFLENAQRLVAVHGEWVPPCHDRVLEQAERLVRCEFQSGKDGHTWVRTDLAQLDWTGASAPNPFQAHWQLMRFHLLGALAAAYRATGEERFARSARHYIEAFLRAYPVTETWTPPPHDGPTSYPGRIGVTQSGGWLGLLHAFLPSDAFDDDFVTRIIEASRHVLSYQYAHVFPGRNIRILHGDMLLLNGLRLDFLPESAAWRALGVRILNDAVNRQLFPDGANREGSPEYHCDVMYLLTPIWKLAQAYPELGLQISTEKLTAMFDYALAVSRPDGALTSMNDASYFPSQGHFGDHVLRARREFFQAANLAEEMPPPCRQYAGVGQVFLRDRWEPDATYITFDATTRHGWHWHPSRNAIQLFAHHRALLVDPGYPFHNAEWPLYGHKTSHHSTLNLNGLDQSHARAWSRFRQAPGYDLVEGVYGGGYWPTGENTHGKGIFGEHHRTLLWIRDRCVVVLDQLTTMPEAGDEYTIESIWQLSEGDAELRDEGRAAVTGHADSNLLLLFPLMPDGMQVALHTGEREPMRGWVAGPSQLYYVPAPMVRQHVRKREPWKVDLATVLIPFSGTEAPRVHAAASETSLGFYDRTAGQLELRWQDGSRDLVIWSARIEEAIDCQHSVDTDAALVHLQFTGDGRFVQGLAVDGAFLRCPALGEQDLIGTFQRM